MTSDRLLLCTTTWFLHWYYLLVSVSGPEQFIDRDTASVPNNLCEQVINSHFLSLYLLIFNPLWEGLFILYTDFHYGLAEKRVLQASSNLKFCSVLGFLLNPFTVLSFPSFIFIDPIYFYEQVRTSSSEFCITALLPSYAFMQLY